LPNIFGSGFTTGDVNYDEKSFVKLTPGEWAEVVVEVVLL